MNKIITLPQLQQAQADAWVLGLIVCVIAIALAIIIAFMIPWRSDRQDYIWRKICFIVIGITLPVCYWLFNTLTVAKYIPNPGFRRMFQETNLYILIVSIALYTIIGIVLMFCFRNTKLGAILGKLKN